VMQYKKSAILSLSLVLVARILAADTQLVVVPKPGESPLTSVTVTVEPNEPVHALLVDMAVGVYEVYVDGVQQKTVATDDGCIEFELERGGQISVQQSGAQRPPDVEVRVGR